MFEWIGRIFKKQRPHRRSLIGSIQKARERQAIPLGSSRIPFDQEIRSTLASYRATARELANQDGYARKFLNLIKANVAGPSGVSLQCRFKNRKGDVDVDLNDHIEKEWAIWSRRNNCDVTGRHGWPELQRLIVQTVARDGEAFIRFVIDPDASHGLKLQLIDPDLVDETYEEPFSRGRNRVTNGIEVDGFGRAVAVYVLACEYDETAFSTTQGKFITRIPMEDMVHVFVTERIDQKRGLTWFHSILSDMRMLAGYREAELMAARIGASKMAFIIDEESDDYVGDGVDSHGNIISEIVPGHVELLTGKKRVEKFDSERNGEAFSEFVRVCLRSIGAGLGVSYASLSNDLSDTSYSSARTGLLEERDLYLTLQNWFIDQCVEPIYQRWLRLSVLKGRVKIPPDRLDEYLHPSFVGRRWAWVDPEKDMNANLQAIDVGLKSRRQVAREMGVDLDDVFREIKAETELAKSYGISLGVMGETKTNGTVNQSNPA